MRSIRITSTPPGFAPLPIRTQWVGVTLPLATKEELALNPPSGLRRGSENLGGHLVLRAQAIDALKRAGKDEAAGYWESLQIGTYLEFSRDVCEPVS